MEDVPIVGGGPAGAYLGYCLAKEGIRATIFDDSHPREKPCGGGISILAIKKFPILSEIPLGKTFDRELRLISPNGREVIAEGMNVSWTVSRIHLDKLLLDKAVEAGAKLVEERVIDFRRDGELWGVKTSKGNYRSKIIVGADGVNSLVRRKLVGPISKENLGLTYGCFAKSNTKEIGTIKFLRGMEGYAWCFPREDHLSIGVGVELVNARHLRRIFDEFMTSYYPHVKVLSRWSAMLPLIKDKRFYELPCSGKNWVLVGDAAGHVDPMTGEGIVYALWSAELAGKAIAENDPKLFDELWRKEYGEILKRAVAFRKISYNPHLLEFSIKVASRSKTGARILYDIINNDPDYQTLLPIIVRDGPRVLKEFILR